MNDLVVKNVPFCGTELLAVQDKKTEKIYAGINLILRELGFDERQIEYRRNKWGSDKAISKGVQKFSYPSDKGGMQEAYCIDIMKLPLALAKLEITPKMEKDMPELSAKLEEYQDRCADVLAEAFLPKKEQQRRLTPEEMLRIQLGMLDEQGERIDGVEIRVDKLENTMTIDYGQQQELQALAKAVAIGAVGGKRARAYTYQYPAVDENDKPPKMYGMVISRLWHDYKDYFCVNSYRDTPTVRFDEALEYINGWAPPTNMQLEIGRINRMEDLTNGN
ncbi:MAG: ORF6C domain-containing protein [Clostridium sp.]|nr:ORF6C domain-containing protein [Clostridium sp.]